MPVTQLAPGGFPGQRYGSFAGKTATVVVVAVIALSGTAVTGTSLSGTAATSTAVSGTAATSTSVIGDINDGN